jgi:hypothetical protein
MTGGQMKRILVAILVVAFAGVAQAQQKREHEAPTRELCDSMVMVLAEPGNIQSAPFKKLSEAEKLAFNCASKYQSYSYSLLDASISQVMLERCEGFIHERILEDKFFEWDAKLSGK